MLPTKFWFIWPSGFRGEDLKKLVNQKQELPVVATIVNWYVGGFPLSFTVFLAHLVKGNVSFCHHLTSVV
jgi:hypothetical protein